LSRAGRLRGQSRHPASDAGSGRFRASTSFWNSARISG
jgi:hypothetical protein